MSRQTILGIALVLFLLGVPLVSFGSTGDNALWWAGLVLLIVAGLIPPVVRYALPDEEEDAPDTREEP